MAARSGGTPKLIQMMTMTSRSLLRRLNQLEDRFKPDSEPMTIRLDFVNVNREVTGSLEFRVGGEAQSSGGIDSRYGSLWNSQERADKGSPDS